MTHPPPWRNARLVALFGAILAADRVTKILAERALSLGSPVEVVAGFFQLTLVHNTGMAFGMLAGASIPGKTWLLTGVSLALLAAIAWFAVRAGPLSTLTEVGIVALLAGALGNIVDRVLYGYVVDFFDFYLGAAHWPAFNIADASICTGVGLLLLDSVREYRRTSRAEPGEGLSHSEAGR